MCLSIVEVSILMDGGGGNNDDRNILELAN